MHIGIVGSGFTGLTAALRLAECGKNVSVIEASNTLGGLASGFYDSDWEWPLEKFYHHIFTNDEAIIRLAKEINYKPFFTRPLTSVYFHQNIHSLDSPIHLLKYPYLSMPDKVRMGATIAFFKLFPWWKSLEKYGADYFLKLSMGKNGYNLIWKPLLAAKFGAWYQEVNAAWFWARIKKRTPKLGYFENGFQGFADRIGDEIKKNGGKIYLNSKVKKIEKKGKLFTITHESGKLKFDKVLVTCDNNSFLSMTSDLPSSYIKRLRALRSLNAITIVLVLNKPLMEKVYWLNVTDQELPFVIVAEHTNFIDKKHYGNKHIVYLGSYLTPENKLFRSTDEQLYQMAVEQLMKINENISPADILKYHVFRAERSQPLATVNYSSLIPSIQTPIDHLYLANMSLVYPWDRGVNYAVKLGQDAVKKILI